MLEVWIRNILVANKSKMENMTRFLNYIDGNQLYTKLS